MIASCVALFVFGSRFIPCICWRFCNWGEPTISNRNCSKWHLFVKSKLQLIPLTCLELFKHSHFWSHILALYLFILGNWKNEEKKYEDNLVLKFGKDNIYICLCYLSPACCFVTIEILKVAKYLWWKVIDSEKHLFMETSNFKAYFLHILLILVSHLHSPPP